MNIFGCSHAPSHLWIVQSALVMSALDVVHVSLFFKLIRIHGHVLGVSFVFLEGPLAFANHLNPVLQLVLPGPHCIYVPKILGLGRGLRYLCSR